MFRFSYNAGKSFTDTYCEFFLKLDRPLIYNFYPSSCSAFLVTSGLGVSGVKHMTDFGDGFLWRFPFELVGVVAIYIFDLNNGAFVEYYYNCELYF